MSHPNKVAIKVNYRPGLLKFMYMYNAWNLAVAITKKKGKGSAHAHNSAI